MLLQQKALNSAASLGNKTRFRPQSALSLLRFNTRMVQELSCVVSATVAPEAPPSTTTDDSSFISPVTVINVDETQYKQQLECKLSKLRSLFQEFSPPELEVFESPPSHYRMRAEFTVDQRDGQLRYVMFQAPSTASAPAPPPPQPSSSEPNQANGGSSSNPQAVTDPVAPETTAAVGSSSGGHGKDVVGVRDGGGGAAAKGPRRVFVDRFSVASRQLNELMEVVRREAAASPELRHKLFQANFHTTLAGDAMITLIYHRKLGPDWETAAGRLRVALADTPTASAAGRVPHVIGRSRKQKLELDSGFVLERLTVGGQAYVQKQVEGSFSQPNAAVCQHMLNWALDVTRPGVGKGAGAGASREAEVKEGANAGGGAAAEDLLELYCGNGNFTVPLAQNFRRVVATEVAKSSVEAARYNLEANGVGNVFLARMASEEFAETMRARGTRRRLEGLGPWEELRLRTIFVDPPRSGLDAFTVQLLQEFDRIVYISCNPKTLHANLRVIATTHRIDRFAAFDQFPYTHHLECGVCLTRR